MSIQHITKYNGSETCHYCACGADLESKYKNIKLHFCHNCLFGSNRNIGLPINIITNRFNTKCQYNDCEQLSYYKLENKTQTTYYCYHHIAPACPAINCLP